MNLKGYRVKPNLFPIPKSYFPKIEYSLGIKLTDNQKEYLNDPKNSIIIGDRVGKTTALLILIALSIGEPIYVGVVTDISDNLNYINNLMINRYREIVIRLESVGFNTREVIYFKQGKKSSVGGWKL